MRYFIDTNIFLRVLTKDNIRQFNSCFNFIQAVKENNIKAYTSTVVLTEVVFTLQSFYYFEKQEVMRALKSIINLKGLQIKDKHDHLRAVELYKKYSIKYIDALIASEDEIFDKKIIVVSYDRDFDKIPVLRKEPQELTK